MGIDWNCEVGTDCIWGADTDCRWEADTTVSGWTGIAIWRGSSGMNRVMSGMLGSASGSLDCAEGGLL